MIESRRTYTPRNLVEIGLGTKKVKQKEKYRKEKRRKRVTKTEVSMEPGEKKNSRESEKTGERAKESNRHFLPLSPNRVHSGRSQSHSVGMAFRAFASNKTLGNGLQDR